VVLLFPVLRQVPLTRQLAWWWRTVRCPAVLALLASAGAVATLWQLFRVAAVCARSPPLVLLRRWRWPVASAG
jgi:hypothetical protein